MPDQKPREATVSRIRWEKAGNPWKSLVMDNGETWVGNTGPVVPGTLLRAYGQETTHPKFGLQFQVEKVEVTVGEETGLLSWLEWRIPHLGTVRAKALLEQYEDFGAALEDPAKLTQISGITEDRAKEMMKAWLEHREELPTLPELADHGLAFGLAIRAQETFKWRLPAVVKTNVYNLIDVDGISFKIIDPVAVHMGIDLKDPRRQCAFARSILQSELHDGHCYMLLRDIVGRITPWGLEYVEVVRNLNQEKRLIIHEENVILLTEVDAAEENVANTLLGLLRRGACSPRTSSELPEWLDPDQKTATRELLTAAVAIMTGGPGTGKSTTLLAALDKIENRGERLALCAPTGKAAQRMTQITKRPATTIHRLLGWDPETGDWKHHATNPLDADVVVIDEASMVDILLCSSLCDALGHARLIIVGDSDQLPPIQGGQPLHDLLQIKTMPNYRLRTIHRQKGDSWVVDNAAQIINGREPSLENTHDFTFLDLEKSEEIVKAAVALYREHGLGMQVLTPEKKKGAGTQLLNTEIQTALNSTSQWDLYLTGGGYKIYKNDKVLYTKNMRDLGLVNGDCGIVQDVYTKGQDTICVVKFDAKEKELPDDYLINPPKYPGCWELRGPEAWPLTLAYAMTVHKAQGSEWEHVVVVADKAHWSLRRQLLYTAVTRTSDKLTILGSREAIARAVQRPRDTNRRTLLKERMQA